MDIKFIYLDLPFWRAEVGRIALYFGNIEFDDIRITRDEFLRVKELGKLDDGTIIPFHQLPCLNVNGKSVCQTGGIARYCGKQSGLYPKKNSLKAALIDQIIDMATDITTMLEPSGAEKDISKKKMMREELTKGKMKRKISFLEELLGHDQEEWFVGNQITIADIAIWRLMGWLTSGNVDYIPPTLLKDFPFVKNICSNVASHPKVIEWVGKTYPKNYEFGNFQ